ncbi:hypothetical protein JCM11641_001147 [Rhodosporidiobolus odoratus]
MLRGHGRPLPPTPAHMRKAENIPEGNAELSGVVMKLGIFTLAMILLPIATYFLCREYVFGYKNLNPSAICAVTMANVVLFSFIYYAFREDQADYERERQEKIENKAKTGKAE